MTKEEAIAELDKLGGDPEISHSSADEVLLQFLASNGHVDIVAAWYLVVKRCGGFWYA